MLKEGAVQAKIILLSMALFSWMAPAYAGMCEEPLELGEWVNSSPDTSDLVRLKLSQPFYCGGLGRGTGADGEEPFYGPYWYVEAFGKCSGRECRWGRVGAAVLPNERYGYYDSYSGRAWLFPLFASFNVGEARSYLYIHASPREQGVLNVRVFTDYPDGGPPDLVEQLRFHRLDGEWRSHNATLVPFYLLGPTLERGN